ncbi:hypothetical protein [Mycobacterium heckeshornense]|nr:hypothetical protein [Mycobacterium heckeshornense]
MTVVYLGKREASLTVSMGLRWLLYGAARTATSQTGSIPKRACYY